MFTQLAFYKILFMVELLVAEFLFTFRLKRKKFYWVRFCCSVFVCLLLAFLCPIFQYNAWYASVLFFCLFGVSVFIQKLCYDEPWLNIFFCTFAAYTVQHFAYECNNVLILVTGISELSAGTGGGMNTVPWEIYGSGAIRLTNGFTYITYFAAYALSYWAGFVIFGRRIKKGESMRLSGGGFLLLAAIVVVIDIVFNAVVVYYSYRVYDKIYCMISFLYNMMLCVVALILQFNMLKRVRLDNELSVVSYLLREKEKQYEISKETIDLINQKCHDMKHQIRHWGSEQGITDQAVNDVEKLISVYDSIIKTGNRALDIILTEKSLVCEKSNIRFTCLAEGEKLNFMRDTDLYSLFGNILDNAIEATRELENEEKKVISISVRHVNEMLVICVKNYFKGHLEFKDGIPQTKKEDHNYHGYGIRSIRRVVENYGGDIRIDAEEDIFSVNIIFPCVPDVAPE